MHTSTATNSTKIGADTHITQLIKSTGHGLGNFVIHCPAHQGMWVSHQSQPTYRKAWIIFQLIRKINRYFDWAYNPFDMNYFCTTIHVAIFLKSAKLTVSDQRGARVLSVTG